MKLRLIVLLALLGSSVAPAAFAQQEVDRKLQMEIMKQNFMKRQGITEGSAQSNAYKQSQQTKQQNQEYRDAVLKAINERKLQLQGAQGN